MQRLAYLLLLAACQPQQKPTPAPSPPPAPAILEPMSTSAVSADKPVDALERPAVVRCDNPRSSCTMVVRVSRHDRSIEMVHAGFIQHLNAPPIRVDARNVYWPGGAANKASLEKVTLDWRHGRVRYLEQDDDELVVVDDSGVYRLPKDGSPRIEIVKQVSAWSAAIGGGHIVWTMDNSISSFVNVDGVQIPDDDPYDACVASDGAVFWHSAASNDSIRTLKGGRAETLVDDARNPVTLTVTSTHIYWVEALKEGRVAARAPRSGGSTERLGVSHELVGSRRNGDRILVDGGHVYWNAAHSVVRAPLDGGDTKIVVTVDIDGDIADFAVDDDHVYVVAEIFGRRTWRDSF